MHLTKRFGIVGASQLPLHYLLAIRSKWSPPQLLTRLSHEQIKTAHQILGRIVCFMFVLHAGFYLNFFIAIGALQKRIKDRDVIFGLMSIVMFLTIGTTALNIIRRWSYRVFYTTHIILATNLVVPLYFHVHHIQLYVIEVFLVILANSVLRYCSQRTYSGTVSIIPGTNLVQVRVPLASQNKTTSWKPGQHVYLSRPTSASPSSGVRDLLVVRQQTNPFTIASLPEQDKHLILVARMLNGNTKQLAKLARSLQSHDGPDFPSTPIALGGPYGSTSRLPDLTKFDRVLLLAGGVGATFIVPIYRSLVEQDRPSFRHDQLRFVWAVRKLAETTWAFPGTEADKDAGFESEGVHHDDEVEIYVTQPSSADLHTTNAEDGIELAETEHLIPFEEEMEKSRKGMVLSAGRPDIDAIVEKVFAASTGKVAVITCGPRGMTKKLRDSVGVWVSQGREVYWHNETFGW
jgi:NAD(P)H-flavin reductase